MTRICWWLVDVVSRLLETDEREAVRGDFAEVGETGGLALRDLVGLVVRRQTALWAHWRPWLALVGLVAPLGLLLSVVARQWAEGSATYAWLYVNNWTWAYLGSPGARQDLAHYSTGFFVDYLTLCCWSWTSGFVLGSLSRRTLWVNGSVFCLVLFGELVAVRPHHNPFNPVFSLTFYSVVFPLILRIVLVLLPALWGMRKGFRLATLPLRQAVFWAVAVTTLTVSAARALQGAVIFGWQLHLRGSLLLRLLPLAMVLPAAYIVASASWRRWRGRDGLRLGVSSAP
jgi:hypothetical protein